MPVGDEMPHISVVICHYNPKQLPYYRGLAAACAGSVFRDGGEAIEVIVSDGSPSADGLLAAECERMGARYINGGRDMMFAETYNAGIREGEGEIVVIMANDIFITGRHVRRLAQHLMEDETVGCAIPYLSFSDYPTQTDTLWWKPRECYPSSMTINVNAFRRGVIEEIGLVPEELTGFYNDVVMFERLKARGLRVRLCNVGTVFHLSAVTRNTEGSTSMQADRRTFTQMYPALLTERESKRANSYAYLYRRMAQMPFAKLLWMAVGILPFRVPLKGAVMTAISRLEPYLSAPLGTYLRALRRKRQ